MTHTYGWTPVQWATRYHLLVQDTTQNPTTQDTSETYIIDEWYTTEEAGCDSEESLCMVTPEMELEGTYAWKVLSCTEDDCGLWSDELQFSYPPPTTPRFTDHGDGTVTDNHSDLMWPKNLNLYGLKNWSDALKVYADLNLANYGDWRLPSINELWSINNTDICWEATAPFENAECSLYYWTSTAYTDIYERTDKAWALSIKSNEGNAESMTYLKPLWCVRTTTSEDKDDFSNTPTADLEERIKNLKLLLPEAKYNILTEGSRNLEACRESNREELGLSDKPNGQWYYTYENLIKGMAEWEESAHEGDENSRKLEIAAFLANIAQETGAKNDKFGGPGCFIQEGGGGQVPDFKAWHDCAFGGCNKTRPFPCRQWPDNWCPDGEVGYFGRGPHQLTHDYNYKAFGKGMAGANGDEDKYLKNPDLLTTEPTTCIAGSIWFWGHAEPNQRDPKNEIPFKPAAHNVAVGTWEPTSEDIACGRIKPNFGVIINIINGGLECGPGAGNPEAAKNRVKYLETIVEEMGVTIPDGFLDDCSSQQNFSACPSY